jgi:hypothetical protein
VTIRHELAVPCQSFQGLLFPVRAVAVDVTKYSWLQYEKGAIDPAFSRLRLLGKLDNLVSFEIQMAKSRRRADGRQRGQLSVAPMKLQQLMQIDVGYTMNASLLTSGSRRLILPPVCTSTPVSTRSTVQSIS